MKKIFKLALVLASMISLFSCSNKVNNPEYNNYFQKVSSIINDFTNSNNKAKKQIFKRIGEKNDEILSIVDNVDGREQKQDILNAFEQSFYIPIIMGKGITEYRKQTNFYDVVAFVDEQYYIKTFLEDDLISTHVYIPSELSFDGVSHYIYFGVNYIDEHNYKFGGVEISDDNSTEWYFYGDSSLVFLEYSKTSERTVIGYQNSNLFNKEINDQNVILDIRNRLEDDFSSINRNKFKSLKDESKFDISKKEYSDILDDLFPSRGGVSTLSGLQVYNDIALGYISEGNETKITLPNTIKAIANDFYISSTGGKIKELFIPKSITKVTDQSGNSVDLELFEIVYRDDNKFYYLENIIVEEGSTLFKIENICLTNFGGDTLLYLMNQSVENLDLLKYSYFSNGIIYNPLPDIITKLKTLKYNLIKEKNSDYNFDIFLNQYASEEANFSAINYDYLEVGNVSNNYIFSIYNKKVSINKLVLNGSFKNVYIDDFNGAIKSVELKSTNSNAQISGTLNGLEVFDVYFNNVSNGESSINLQKVKKIIVHEGVSEFSLDKFEIDYYVNGYMELYLPSTLKKFECEKLSYGDKLLKVKIISKVNEVMFIDFSRLKAFGCEIKIEDNEELDNIFSNYEYVTYAYNKKGELTNNAIRLKNYLGNEEELYVPNKINSLPVTEFYISSKSSIDYEPMTNTKTLKRLHLPNSLTCFSYEQSYVINGSDYSDERNYHLESLYYDGTYNEFKSFFESTYYLIEHQFCKEIVFTDQTIKNKTEEIKDEIHYSDLTILKEEINNGDETIISCVTIVKPYIIFDEGEYHLYFSILEKQYDIKLTKNDGFYNGVGNYEKIGKMEFLFYEDATLKIRFTYNEEVYEYFFEKLL